mmetsp:Transcript_53076/g.126615  ORF Transcript_53076/g.126615 Transcript_53076/m.126615 type:complete len:240 (+) Transcript_53076:283-1002(+)
MSGFLLVGSRGQDVSDNVQWRHATQLVGVHPDARHHTPKLPIDHIDCLGDTPEAESVHLVRREVLHEFSHCADVILHAFGATHADVVEVTSKVWFLANLCNMELVEGPHWHYKCWRFCLFQAIAWVLTWSLVELLSYCSANGGQNQTLCVLNCSRLRVPRNMAHLQPKEYGSIWLLLEANLHPHLPQSLPPCKMPAVWVVPTSLLLWIMSWAVQDQELERSKLVLRCNRLGCVGTPETF